MDQHKRTTLVGAIRGGRLEEVGLEEAREFFRHVLDAMAANVVVLDHDGFIVLVNKAWQDLAKSHGVSAEACWAGSSYLDICRADSDPTAKEALEGIEGVLDGRAELFRMEYPCAGPSECRWYEMRVTPLPYRGELWAVAAHVDITERRLIEQERRDTRWMLQAVLDTIPVRVFWKDCDLCFLGCNKMFATDAGLDSPAEIVGKTDWEMPWCEQAEQYRADDRLVIDTGEPKLHFEEVQDRADGRRIWLSTSKIPLLGEQGEVHGVMGTYENITDRKLSEQQLRGSRRMLQVVLDTIPVRVFWKDLDLRYLGCNKMFAADAGLESPAEIVGKTDGELPWPEQAELFRADDRAVIDSGEPKIHFEEPQARLDGQVTWLSTSKVPLLGPQGEICGVLGTYEDITARKHIEQQLREKTRLNETLLDSLPCVALLVRSDTQEIIAANQAARAMGAAPGERCYDVVVEDNSICPWCRAPAAVAKGESQKAEIEVQGRTWEVHWIPIDEDHRLHYAFDLTERKRAEQERQQLESRVQHAQKLESLGVLAGGIAHDFNNLLVSILGNADLAISELPEGSSAARSVREIRIASIRASELTNQMLAYSGKGRFVVEPVDLEELIRDMVDLLEVSISKKVSLRCEFADQRSVVNVDRAQIRQVVMNLITNASDAIGDSPGVITIRARTVEAGKTDRGAPCLEPGLEAGPYVQMEVTDTGCGMDEKTQRRLFDPFFTTKFAGRGLGLAAVQGIIRGHKGVIRVSSEVGRGSSFIVLLPASSAPLEPISHEAESVESWRGEGTVLVVDDESTVRNVADAMLAKSGLEVVTAGDGVEALEIFTRDPDRIAVVLLDMTMPEMGGAETLTRMLKIRPDVKVILTSGYNEQDVTAQVAEGQPAGFIQKPFRMDALIAEVRSVLDSS